MNTQYPKRTSHFAHKLTRLLFKSCAAQAIGHHAVCLVVHVAHTEDAARYQGPVRFWNSQLMEVLGFKSPKQLTAARDKAVESGWLVYQRANDRSVGHYWTDMPMSVRKFDDDPIEETCSGNGMLIHSEKGKDSESGTRIHSENGTRSGMHCGTHCGTRSGKPSNPNPNPTPIPKKAAKKPPAYPPAFLNFWLAYPPNAKGRKRGQGDAFAIWKTIPAADQAELLEAARNYGREETEYVRDPERFLKKDWWRGWTGAPEPIRCDRDDVLPDPVRVESIAERRRQISAERKGASADA